MIGLVGLICIIGALMCWGKSWQVFWGEKQTLELAGTMIFSAFVGFALFVSGVVLIGIEVVI